MRAIARPVALALACAATPQARAFPPPERIADTFVRDANSSSYPVRFMAVGDKFVFSAESSRYGDEGAGSDGTAAGTAMLFDFEPGPMPGVFQPLGRAGGRLVGMTYGSFQGETLWITDGTPGGTSPLWNPVPGPYWDTIQSCAEVGNYLVFCGRTPETGVELCSTDGTTGGSGVIADFRPGPESTVPVVLGTAGGLAYLAVSTLPIGYQLWVTDGTSAGTRQVTRRSAEFAAGVGVEMGGLFYFLGRDRGSGEGLELWVSDGTDAGTVLVKDIWPGPADGWPERLTVVGNRIFFTALNPGVGRELWLTDGTTSGTVLVKDIDTAPDVSSNPNMLTSAAGLLFFRATTAAQGEEVWRSDGTEAGTSMLADFYPGPTGSEARLGYDEGSAIIFGARDGATGRPLWRSDGTTTGTSVILPIASGGPDVGNCWFEPFSAGAVFCGSDSTAGMEPWYTDGTAAGTYRIADVKDGTCSAFVESWVATDDGIVYVVSDGYESGSPRLAWRTRGTTETTVQLTTNYFIEGHGTTGRGTAWFGNSVGLYDARRIERGAEVGPRSSSNVLYVPPPSDFILHASWIEGLGTEPHATRPWDGTTTLLADLEPGTSPSRTWPIGALPGRGFFGVSGSPTRLYVTDGSAAGTIELAGPRPLDEWNDYDTRQPGIAAAGVLFFIASDSSAGMELWRSDGTAGGTFRVSDFMPGTSDAFEPPSPGPMGLRLEWVDAGAQLLLAATSPQGRELWRSDGTVAGTRLVAELRPGPGGSCPMNFVADGRGGAWFAAEGPDGYELHVTDGTTAGTRQVVDIWPGPGSSRPGKGVVLPDGRYVFPTEDPIFGRELWITDGTAAGTSILVDIAPGLVSSSPDALALYGGTLCFFAFSDAGYEPWALDVGVGPIPDGAWAAGTPLRVRKQGGDIVLTWARTCLGDETDYAIHLGASGSTGNATTVTCTTAGVTTWTMPSPPGDAYFLVGALRESMEGSLGVDSFGRYRTEPVTPCGDSSPVACR